MIGVGAWLIASRTGFRESYRTAERGFLIAILKKRYLNNRSIEVEAIANNRRYDLYILAGDEIPFMQDGLRDGEHIRHRMHKRFIEALTEKSCPWALVTGDLADRISHAVRYIDEILVTSHP